MSFISTTIRSPYSKENITSRRGKKTKNGADICISSVPLVTQGRVTRGDISDQCPLSIIYINMCLLFENEHVGAKQENTKRKEKTKKMKRKKPNNFDVSNQSFFNCEFVIPHLKLSIGTFSHKQTNKLWPHNELGPRTKFAIVIMFCMSCLPFW